MSIEKLVKRKGSSSEASEKEDSRVKLEKARNPWEAMQDQVRMAATNKILENSGTPEGVNIDDQQEDSQEQNKESYSLSGMGPVIGGGIGRNDHGGNFDHSKMIEKARKSIRTGGRGEDTYSEKEINFWDKVNKINNNGGF